MPLWVTFQPWVFITMCWNGQYGFNLVRTNALAGIRTWIAHSKQFQANALDRSAAMTDNRLKMAGIEIETAPSSSPKIRDTKMSGIQMFGAWKKIMWEEQLVDP